jgi:hypothetical protein
MARTTEGDGFAVMLTSLAGLAGDEARKAKLLWLRNQIAEFEGENEDAQTFGVVQIIFALIPFFWPILWAQRRSMVTAAKTTYRQISNALDTWKTELGEDGPVIAAELERVRARSPRMLPWGKKAA